MTKRVMLVEDEPNIIEAIREADQSRIAGVHVDPWAAFEAMTMPCLVLRGEGLEDGLTETDPQRTGVPPLPVKALRPEVVANDPNALASAQNKTYLQLFPEEVRARTLVSIDRDEIKQFIDGAHPHGLDVLLGKYGYGELL